MKVVPGTAKIKSLKKDKDQAHCVLECAKWPKPRKKRDLTHFFFPEDGLEIRNESRPTVLIVSVLHLDEIFITGRKWGRHPIRRTGEWVKVFPFLSQFDKKKKKLESESQRMERKLNQISIFHSNFFKSERT